MVNRTLSPALRRRHFRRLFALGLAASALGAVSPLSLAQPQGLAASERGDADVAGVRRADSIQPHKVCGTQSLDGPTKRPPGAKVVRPTQNLGIVVDNAKAGTTFYLLPGAHLLGNDVYDQVQPKSGDTFIGAPGAVLDGQSSELLRVHRLRRERHRVLPDHPELRDTDRQPNEGVVNHDSAHGWYIHHNTVQNSGGAGRLPRKRHPRGPQLHS